MHNQRLKVVKYSLIFVVSKMIKRYLLLASVLFLVLSTMEGCFLQKNKCDSCPGISKHKKVRKHNKGSL
jgi:hypothetical protein